ncbi:hypothetical protein B566_EDAN014529 [Ephemera danica]|nr:hypothetical protein B566_EDAN014529 [Ephemera danica]
MYEICDMDREKIQGRFYEKELQQVALPPFFKVDKVLGKRGNGSKAEVFVSWKGYPFYPYIKSGFSALTGELLKGDVGVLSDTVRQVPVRESLANRVKIFGNNLTEKAVNKVQSMSGSGIRKRKRKATRAHVEGLGLSTRLARCVVRVPGTASRSYGSWTAKNSCLCSVESREVRDPVSILMARRLGTPVG